MSLPMPPTIAVVSCGAMGAAVGRRLHDNGARVITELAGRSAASRARAAAAGMQDAPAEALAGADFFLSILPPGEALALAHRMAGPLTAATRKAIFVDCNAISPVTAEAVAAAIAPSGARFVDGSIIGAPPVAGRGGPVFYLSGADAPAAMGLASFGLETRLLEGAVGAASGLKMCYGGITKGVTALASAMMLAADRCGAAPALRAEMARSLPFMLSWFETQVPGMFPKAYRWVAEMQEVSEFLADDPQSAAIYAAVAQLYARLAEDVAGPGMETAALGAFFTR